MAISPIARPLNSSNRRTDISENASRRAGLAIRGAVSHDLKERAQTESVEDRFQRPSSPATARRGRIWSRIGTTLLSIGVLLLLFVAFQLWGTGLYTDHEQSDLKQQLSHTLGHDAISSITKLPGSKPGGSSPSDATTAPKIRTTVAPAITPPAVGQPIGLLAIPRIGLDDALVQGTGQQQLQGGPGHYVNTPLPGEMGNVAIAGHRTTFAAPFYDLNELAQGDPIYIQTSQGLFEYIVTGQKVVPANDNAVLDTATVPELTLTTCNPRYSASQRLVVVALLDTKAPHGSTGATKTAQQKTPTRTSSPKTHDTPTSAGTGTAGNTGDVLPAVVWGILFLVGALVLRLGSKRLSRKTTVAAYAVGIPVLLVVLFVCFEHVSLALPASF